MTNQEKKGILCQYRNLQREIWVKLQEIEQLKSLAEKITPSYSMAPNGTSGGNRIESAVEKIEKIEKEISEKISILSEEKNKIGNIISSVENPTYRAVLTQRYILGRTWDRIAVDMHYSRMQICRIHGYALGNIKML